jgi:ethanolamine utilization protein EutN
MFIAKVVGSTWATVKHRSLENRKMMLIRPMDGITGKLSGKIQMAVDGGVGAGIGDSVLILDEGTGARQILDDPKAPIRAIIVGIIDEVTMGSTVIKHH